jgi:hypothetical protein
LTAPITAAASEHQRLRTAAQTGPAATTACKNARRWLLLAGEGQRSNAVSWTSNSAPRKVGKLKLLAKQSAAGLLSRPARTSWAPPAEMPKILEKQPTIPRLHQPPLAATLFRPLSSTLSTRRERRSKRSSARASARTHETGTVCHVLFPECSDTYEHVLLRQSGHLPLTSRPQCSAGPFHSTSSCCPHKRDIRLPLGDIQALSNCLLAKPFRFCLPVLLHLLSSFLVHYGCYYSARLGSSHQCRHCVQVRTTI